MNLVTFMEIEEFCLFIKEKREKSISRTELARRFPWHLSTLRGYERDTLCDIDYLAVLSKVTGADLQELITMRVAVGILRDTEEFDDVTNHLVTALSKHESVSNIGGSQDEQLLEFKNLDDSMAPTIMKNSILLIDDKNKTLRDGEIFCLKMGDRIVPRQIQMGLNYELNLVAFNENYVNTITSKDKISQSSIVGRLVKVINVFDA